MKVLNLLNGLKVVAAGLLFIINQHAYAVLSGSGGGTFASIENNASEVLDWGLTWVFPFFAILTGLFIGYKMITEGAGKYTPQAMIWLFVVVAIANITSWIGFISPDAASVLFL